MLELQGEVTETEGLARARPRNSYRVCEATGGSRKGERGRDASQEGARSRQRPRDQPGQRRPRRVCGRYRQEQRPGAG